MSCTKPFITRLLFRFAPRGVRRHAEQAHCFPAALLTKVSQYQEAPAFESPRRRAEKHRSSRDAQDPVIFATKASSKAASGTLPWAMRALPPPRPPASVSAAFSSLPASTPESTDAASNTEGGSFSVAT